MKLTTLLFQIICLTFICADLKAQDPTFSQWENIPIYFNPALTGDFDGQLRFRVKYRDQWRSFLGENSFRTGAASAEYKFSGGEKRKVNLGFFTLNDEAGSAEFIMNSYHLTTSVIQNLGNNEENYHSLSVGVDVGIQRDKIKLSSLNFPMEPFSPPIPEEDLIDRISYFDLSAGLNWEYQTKSHFSMQLGIAFSHLNRPDDSFSGNRIEGKNIRLNIHGNIEIPLAKKISVIPSFLYLDQGPANQLLFGLSSKWYLKQATNNALNLGFFAKTTQNFNGRSINVFVGSATLEIKSILIGFSYDRFPDILDGSAAYEFSLGYTFGSKR